MLIGPLFSASIDTVTLSCTALVGQAVMYAYNKHYRENKGGLFFRSRGMTYTKGKNTSLPLV